MPAKVIIFIGPQGSGKGTQAKILVQRFSAVLIETGALLREATKQGTEFGKYVKDLIDNGSLVPDPDIEKIVREKLESLDESTTVVFDGMPRTLRQAEFLVKSLRDLGRNDIETLHVSLPREETFKRLSMRRVCEDCKTPAIASGDPEQVCASCGGKLVVRKDDTPESIEWRLEQYERDTVPILDYMKENTNFHVINGNQKIEKVSKDIAEALSLDEVK